MSKKEFEHPHEKSHHIRKKLTLGLIIVTSVIVVAVWGLLTTVYVVKNDIAKRSVQDATTKTIATTLKTNNTSIAPNITKVTSHLGFSLAFDATAYDTYGQVTDLSSTNNYITGESYAGDELKVDRDYSIVRLRTLNNQSQSFSNTPELNVSTNIRKDFWTTRESKPGNSGKSKIDLLTDFLLTNSSIDPTTTTSKISDVTIGTVTYKKIIISVSNEKYGIQTPNQTFIYATVQNDRPFWSTINYSALNTPEIAQFESVIRSISYDTPTSKTLSYEQKKLTFTTGFITASTTFTLPKNSTNVPETLSDDTLIKVVARNQPAVVRVMLVYCADMQLNDGANTVDLKDACTWGVGSGSIISSDGYILTNGHVVNMDMRNVLSWGIFKSPQSTRATLDFMVSAGLMTKENVDSLIAGVNAGDKGALSALDKIGDSIPASMITPKNVTSQYAIQLGDDPVKIDETGTRWVPIYKPTNIKATLVDQDYDASTSGQALSSNGQATTSDVAILKATGSFPTIALGGIDSVKAGDQLTAIGYPAFVDGGPDTKKSTTVPSATQGTIIDRISDGTPQDRQLLTTTVPIAHGNSGGPALNSNGEQIGLNTYSYFSCPDQQCFGDGVVRDIADAKALIAKNKIAVGDFGTDTRDWYQALDQYTVGNFAKAISSFENIQKNYPANYMVQPLLTSAKQQLGTSTDTSASYQTVDNLNIVVIVVSVVGAAIVVSIVVLIVIYTRKHRRELLLHTTTTATV